MSNLNGSALRSNLKLVEMVEVVKALGPLDAVMASLRTKTAAKKAELVAGLEPLVDEIELALSEEHGELEDIRRLRRLIKLREQAARGHAARAGRLLQRAKRTLPHGHFVEWCEAQGYADASEYIRLAKQWRTAP